MAASSHIEWTDATWNPVTGCTLVSEGCRNCYAAELAAGRLQNHPSRKGLAVRNADGIAKFTGEVRFNEQWLDQPLRWRKPRRIFVCAHGDLFHESVPDEWIDRVFAVMALAPQHVFQVLTKRPERMREYMLERGHAAYNAPRLDPNVWPAPNVWLGVSVEDQATSDERIPPLLATPASLRFLSAEPLLGLVDLNRVASPFYEVGFYDALNGLHRAGPMDDGERVSGVDWVIAGGESGARARPCHPMWIRSLRDQCAAAGVPFFFKQWGGWAPYRLLSREGVDVMGVYLNGDVYDSHVPERLPFAAPGVATMLRVGKATAGSTLDGEVIQQMPCDSAQALRSKDAAAP
ncbi:phage Gp37/Gp68 family protein [Hyphobacterium sp.]|uniref:phage Gp37/Gp68 family protein n=1 Tax=Hyphobacterium sp. TaxID=2004662 RepID=UPI003B52AD4D